MILRIIEWTLLLAIGGVFCYAGVVKAIDPARFAQDIDVYQILPYRGAVALALYLPYLEILCGVGVITGWLRRGATAMLATLVALFIAAAASAWARGLDVSCGCFGQDANPTHAMWLIARNVL